MTTLTQLETPFPVRRRTGERSRVSSSLSARRPAAMLATYLALTLVPAMVAARAGIAKAPVVLAAHTAALAFLGLLLSRRDSDDAPVQRWAIALAPLVAIPFLYGELPTLMAAFKDGYWDAIVQPWERAVFGGMPARTLAPSVLDSLGSMVSTVVSEVFYASYLSYYLIIYIPPILLLVRQEYEVYARTLAGMMTAFLSCFLAFVVFPVEGPRYIWPAPDVGMEGPIRALTHMLVEAGSSRGAEFPSSHVAVAMAQSIMALKWQRRLGVAALIATFLLSGSVVFAGYHYAVDVLAGAALGAVIGVVAIRLPLAPRAKRALQP